MSEYILRKRYSNFTGLDLKANDLNRGETFASDMLNSQYREDGAITKRKGFKAYAASQGGFGLYSFNKFDPSNGVITPQILSASSKLHLLNEVTLSVSYVGLFANLRVSLFFSIATDQYHCLVTDGVTTALDVDLNIGVDEASSYSVASLIIALNLISGVTATATGDTSIPAAFLDIVRDHDLIDQGALTLKGGYWSEVNAPHDPFTGSETNKNSADFENISSTIIQNVLYLSNVYDEVKKYDGQNVYRAGLPNPTIPTVSPSGTGLTGDYIYKVQFFQKDAAGNIIEGNWVDSISYTLTNQTADVTIFNILAASGFNTNCAIVAGAQIAVNIITVDDGSSGTHTMKVGDTAYFYDSVSMDYVERKVTAISSTTITIDGAPVSVADNAVISNNLRIELYRTQASGVDFYSVVDLPNNSFSTSQVYSDALSDSDLLDHAQFVQPLTTRDAPPKGKYLSQFQGQLMVLGNDELRNTVFFSDSDGPEYFPLDTNSLDVESIGGDFITGGATNNNVFAIFKSRSTHILSGNLPALTVRLDQSSNDIGCVAHASIQEIDGSLVWLSERGPYVMNSGQVPTPLNGGLIEKAFDTRGLYGVLEPKLKRAIGFTHRRDKQYWLIVPRETSHSGNIAINENTTIYVFDYYRPSFYKWDSINFMGGIVSKDNDVYFSERRYSSFTGSVVSYLWKQLNIKDAYDYMDHVSAVTFKYFPQWEFYADPSLLKRFLRLKYFGDESTPNSTPVVNAKTEINFSAGDYRSDIDFDFSDFGYGLTPYGVYGYGDYRSLEAKHKLSTERCRAIRVSFFNNEKQANVEILGWELEIVLPFRKGLKP